jgi:electron transport complex protein RnfD
MLLFGGHGFDLNCVLCEVFGGGLMLGAWFMATDYVSSPITPNGQIVYAVILGCLTGIFRVFGNSAEGVSFAIIFTNILVPIIEMYTMPKAFGREGEKK